MAVPLTSDHTAYPIQSLYAGSTQGMKWSTTMYDYYASKIAIGVLAGNPDISKADFKARVRDLTEALLNVRETYIGLDADHPYADHVHV